MNQDDDNAFENGVITPVVGFIFPNEDDEDREVRADVESAGDERDWRQFLIHTLLVLAEGRSDGIAGRLGAVSRLLGVYSTDEQAAKAVGVVQSSITRNKHTVRETLEKAARNHKATAKSGPESA